ncbi:hypothetical protein DPMN_163175 [Dreissena polymorpha]|uniref:Uncharacterized protein n=1 Tax=Dreissena polymorpha TaxID=45954 RepID=A0A9D4IR41_DREPO|nr:hypothetical protein DPMN_163175 [Dreissena polymorpha]
MPTYLKGEAHQTHVMPYNGMHLRLGISNFSSTFTRYVEQRNVQIVVCQNHFELRDQNVTDNVTDVLENEIRNRLRYHQKLDLDIINVWTNVTDVLENEIRTRLERNGRIRE